MLISGTDFKHFEISEKEIIKAPFAEDAVNGAFLKILISVVICNEILIEADTFTDISYFNMFICAMD